MTTIAQKTKILIEEGYPPKQAYAIAHKMLDKKPRKKRKKKRKFTPIPKEKTAWERQQPRRKGAIVNESMPRPNPYCEPVDSEMCGICGEYYAEVVLNAGGIQEASDRIRSRAGGWEKGGGYRSRGPLLWTMHILKLEAWYERHFSHCEIAMQFESYGQPVPFPPSIIWSESFGTPQLKRLSDQWANLYELELKKDPFSTGVLLPSEYSPQMNRLLVKIQQLVNRQEPKRRRLELPNRQQAFEIWKVENFESVGYDDDIPF